MNEKVRHSNSAILEFQLQSILLLLLLDMARKRNPCQRDAQRMAFILIAPWPGMAKPGFPAALE